MAAKREWRRVGAASATVSAGAVMFLTAGTGPAAAQTGATGQGGSDCKLGTLLCSILGGGTGTPAAPPKSSPKPSSSSKPRSTPKARPRPAAHPRHRSARSGGGTGSAAVRRPVAPPADATAPRITSPQAPPALPDLTSEEPVVSAGRPAARGNEPMRLVAVTDPAEQGVPPLLVATASGIVGAVAALHLSLLSGRSRRRAR